MDGEKTFLVVDDVPMFRELGTLFLSRYGRVLTATNGAQALEIARRERLDLVVLDLHLPDLDGEEVCRALRRIPGSAETPVIAMAGKSSEDHARAIRAGASDVLAKPLSRVSLVESALRFLEGVRPRGLPRADVEAPVRVLAGDGECWGTVRNVSRGGLFIEADCPLRAEEEVRLEFALPDARSYAPSARLVWRRPGNGLGGGMGLRFVELDRESARRLDAFVHERSRPPRDRVTRSLGVVRS